MEVTATDIELKKSLSLAFFLNFLLVCLRVQQLTVPP